MNDPTEEIKKPEEGEDLAKQAPTEKINKSDKEDELKK